MTIASDTNHCKCQMTLEVVEQGSTRIPRPAGGGSSGQ